MTDNRRGSIAYYAVIAGVMLTMGIAIGGAFVLVVLFA